MLEISKISHCSAHTKDWLKQRMGKVTASKFGILISEKNKDEFTKGAMTYLYGLAGEILTGERADDEIFNDDIDWGNAHEPEAIKWVASKLKYHVLSDSENGSTHRLIVNSQYSGCTPDALLSKSNNTEDLFDSSGEKIKVFPLEVKCPRKHHQFISMFLCDTPKELKAVEKIYYWQVIFQLLSCDSLYSFFAVYSPKYEVKGKIIKFSKLELIEDIKQASSALARAEKLLPEIVNKLSKKYI